MSRTAKTAQGETQRQPLLQHLKSLLSVWAWPWRTSACFASPMAAWTSSGMGPIMSCTVSSGSRYLQSRCACPVQSARAQGICRADVRSRRCQPRFQSMCSLGQGPRLENHPNWQPEKHAGQGWHQLRHRLRPQSCHSQQVTFTQNMTMSRPVADQVIKNGYT